MKKICLTPVKNEDWVLESFLDAASLWADIIIIADQHSTDKTEEIARSFSKVHYIKNDSSRYDEAYRQKLLLSEARKFGSGNFILALDADEILSANFLESKEWDTFFSNQPGTTMSLQWANVSPDFKSYWTGFQHFPVGFIDNGKEGSGVLLHSPRIPLDSSMEDVKMKDVMLLHLQYTYWERMLTKQVWYQLYERYNHPEKSYVDIYEQYNHFKYLMASSRPIPQEWLYSENDNGVVIKINKSESVFFWEADIKKMIEDKGVGYFNKLMIWNYPFMFKYKDNVSFSFFSRAILPSLLRVYGGLPNRFYKRWLKYLLTQVR